MRTSVHRRYQIAWLLLSVYIPMLVTVTLHHHDEAATAVVYCQDCAHHIHHSGHVYALQDTMHDCVLCQLQSMLYILPAITMLAAVAMAIYTALAAVCPGCRLVLGDVRSTRAPPHITCII